MNRRSFFGRLAVTVAAATAVVKGVKTDSIPDKEKVTITFDGKKIDEMMMPSITTHYVVGVALESAEAGDSVSVMLNGRLGSYHVYGAKSKLVTSERVEMGAFLETDGKGRVRPARRY